MAGIFRAYDIRGVYGKGLDEAIMRDIGRAVGTLYKKVLLGADLRYSSPKLKDAFISGFKTTGSKLYVSPDGNFGMVWYSAHLKNAICAYITASHLASQWNGLKIYYPDGTSPVGEIKRIESMYKEKNFNSGKGEVEELDISNKYFNLLKENFDVKCSPAIDFGGGATTKGIPRIWKDIAKKPYLLYEKPDPFLEVRNPEPKEDNLAELKKIVKTSKKDVGIAYDGDGDRASFIDDKGEFVATEKIIAFLAEGMHKPKIVMNVECSNVIRDYLPDAKIYEVPVGHTYVTTTCKKYKADFGVEPSGHFIVGKYFYFDDAIIASMAVADKLKTKLSDFTKKLPKYYHERIGFEVKEEKKYEIMQELKEKLGGEYKILTIDGIKVVMEDAWVLIRPSNTESKIRMTIETKTKEKLERLKKEFGGMIK